MKPLAEALADDTKWRDAAEVLAQVGPPAADPVVGLLTRADVDLRRRAAATLADRRIGRAVPAVVLAGSLKDGDALVQRSAARALANLGAGAKEAVGALAEVARQSPDLAVRIFAVRALGAVGPEAAPAAGSLIALLAHESLSLRAAAVEALGRLGPGAAEAVASLQRMLLNAKEDRYVRARTAEALGRLGSEGLNVLAKALDTDQEWLAFRCALALAAAGKDAVPLAEGVLTDPTASARGRRFAAFALAKIGPGAAEARAAVERAASDADPAVRRNALEALARIVGEQALERLVAALNDPAPDVARAAASAIESVVADPAAADALLADYRARTAWKQTGDPARVYPLADDRTKYEVGGPLAGWKLPLFPTLFGEAPGYPGCIPALAEEAKRANPESSEFTAQDQAPEWDLYPGSVEHWRGYWFKYCPQRSFFDRQSQVKNWVAPDLPGAGAGHVEEYAAPVYWVPRHDAPRPTGRFAPPVPVVRCRVKSPVIHLDLGVLPIGVYAVRVIGAVETAQGGGGRRFLLPLYLRMNIDDGLRGEVNTYRMRCGYVDEFYSVVEFYFHAHEPRRYRADLFVDEGSAVDLLVRNISLDDALAGTVRAPIKARPVHVAAPAKVRFRSRYLAEERLARDAELWNGLPPLNAQVSEGYWPHLGHFQYKADVVRFGMDGLPASDIEERYGAWRPVNLGEGWDLVFLVNDALGLVYTADEYRARRPLPDPYPYKDDGAGLYQPDPDDPNKGQVWVPVADAAYHRRRWYGSPDARKAGDAWVQNGDMDPARDEAIALIRMALRVPTIEAGNDDLDKVTTNPAAYERDLHARRRHVEATWLSHYPNYREPAIAYDKLFTYIDGNEELAASVSRFVPWVKTSKDLVQLLDVYLVQTIAKRILRYHYYTGPMEAAELALILDNPSVAGPWIDWVFSRTFVYPLPPAGIQELMITGCDRSGPEYIASTFYAQGEGAARVAESLERFRKLGALPPKYDLTRPDLYPKPLAQCYWQLDTVVAGHDFLRIGDVCGADKAPGHTLLNVPEVAANGWKWSRDPLFAWLLVHTKGQGTFDGTDEEWAEVERAAATVPRAPWLDRRSRQVYNWAGVLETGHLHDDWRFRRAVYVRTGLGTGHHHDDSLDLQIVAHGLPMTIDGGQRPGYSSPGDRTTRTHNLVEVDGRGHWVQSWVETLSDAEGARYLSVRAAPPHAARLYRRQVALLDVDEGEGSQPLPIAQQMLRAKLPEGVVTANSYVFDVFRVSGGRMHTYCFHGPYSDEVLVNARGFKPVTPPKEGEEPTPDQAYLRAFGRTPETWFAGDASSVLEATWRYTRHGPQTAGSEQYMAGPNFSEASPRKYLRLRLFDAEGLRVLRADGLCHARDYRLNHVFAQRRSAGDAPLESAFFAVMEPYAGDPFIEEASALPIPDNDADALKAVAVQVKTKNGHTDVLSADGRPEKVRTFGDYRAAAEFAFHSRDAEGLRAAVLTGGTLLESGDLRLRAAARELRARVTAVDYLKRQATIDAAWPAGAVGRVFEIGTPARTTSYTLKAVAPAEGGSVLTLDLGADYFRSQIKSVDPERGTVACQINPTLGAIPGLDKDFTATDDAMTKSWRADYLGNSTWRLRGGPVSEQDFQPAGALRVWEYGVGDEVRLSTTVSVRRVEKGVFEVSGDADVALALRGAAAQVSRDGETWTDAGARRQEGWIEVALPLAKEARPFRLRIAE